MIFKSAIVCFVLSFLVPTAFAKQFFTEIYPYQSLWKVDHFQVEENKLQERVSERAFQYEFQALAYAKTLPKFSQKSKFKFVTTEINNAPLWKVTNSWDQAWEDRYAKWVAENLDVDFFVRNNFKTDCADVAYALRWIFARNFGLPSSGTLAGSGTLVTQEVMKSTWLSLPTHPEWQKDQRFMTALRWVLDNVYTKTLYKDTYPVALIKETIKPGLIHLTGPGGTHTEVFNKVSFDPEETPLEVMSSTLPVMVRQLSRRIFMDRSLMDSTSGGLIRFRWPVRKNGKWTQIEKEQMPYYSLEQYEEDLCGNQEGLARCIMQKIGIKFQPELIIKKVIAGHEAIIKERIQWVKAGFEFCKTNDCSPGTQGYEDYGTPSRDKRINDNFKEFSQLSSDLGLYNDFYKWEVETTLTDLPIKLTMAEFKTRLNYGLVSFDPRDSIGARWALNNEYIHETVSRKLKSGEVLRNALIQKAASCRKEPYECKKSKTSFKELSSLEVDHMRRSTLVNWKKFCEESECKLPEVYEKEFLKMWGQSPAPWDSVAERLGDISSFGKGHILKASSVKYAFEDYIILDGKRLYSIESRQLITLIEGAEIIEFDRSIDKLFILKGGKISLFDKGLTLTGEIEIPSTNPTSEMHLFNNGKVLYYSCSYSCPGTDNKALLIDLALQKIIEEYPIKGLIFEKESHSNALLFGDKNNTLLTATSSEIKISQIPSYKDNIQEFLVLDNDEILATGNGTENYWLAFYRSGQWEQTAESMYITISKINSSYIYVTSYSVGFSGAAQVYDMNGNPWKDPATLYSVLKPGKDRRLGLRKKGQEIEAFIFDGPTISPLFIGKNSSPISTWENWYSAYTGKGGAAVFNYDGSILKSSEFFAQSNCYSTNFFNVCSDEAQDLHIDYYMLNTDSGSRSYYRIGSATELEIDEVYAYTFQNNGEESYFYSEREDKEGKFINLSGNYIMWFPR